MKKILALMLAGVMAFSISACESGGREKNETSAAEETEKTKKTEKDSGKSCPMSVITSYGGTDISGKALESGEFTETFTVSAGDVFRENDNGHWLQNSDNKKLGVIAKIKKVDDDSVTFMLGDVEMQTSYGAVSNVSSLLSVDDGANYSYRITFGSQAKPLPELTTVPETTEAPVTTEAPDKNMSVACGEQGFSTVCGSGLTTEYVEGDGLYIYTDPRYTQIPYVLINRIGSLPIDIGQYIEEVSIATAMENYGDDLRASSQFSDYDFAGGKYNACQLKYILRNNSGTEFNITMICIFAEFNGEYVSFAAKYFDNEGDATMAALETAIKNFKINSPAPAKPETTAAAQTTSAPASQPPASQPASYTLVNYKYGDVCTISLPKGWKFEAAGQYSCFGFHAYDPNDPDVQIFYYLQLSPFYNSPNGAAILKSIYPNDNFTPNHIYVKDVADLYSKMDEVENQCNKVDAPMSGLPSHDFPDIRNVTVTASYEGNYPFKAMADVVEDKILKIKCTSKKGAACKGTVSGCMTESLSFANANGTALYPTRSVWSCIGIIAPEGTYDSVAGTLGEALKSFRFTDEYLKKTYADLNSTLEVSLEAARAYDDALEANVEYFLSYIWE